MNPNNDDRDLNVTADQRSGSLRLRIHNEGVNIADIVDLVERSLWSQPQVTIKNCFGNGHSIDVNGQQINTDNGLCVSDDENGSIDTILVMVIRLMSMDNRSTSMTCVLVMMTMVPSRSILVTDSRFMSIEKRSMPMSHLMVTLAIAPST